MFHYFPVNKRVLILFPLLIILFSSCSRHIKYIQDKEKEQKEEPKEYITTPNEYKLQPYDYLYVDIKTTNKEVNELFETISTSRSTGGNGNQGGQDFFFTGYLVTDSGYVNVPILGDFLIAGKTISEVRTMITDRTHEISKEAIVNVRLTSFNITFLGEFSQTGTVSFFQERVTVLDAVASAGGISSYGSLTKVMVLRKYGNKYVTYHIDLTDIKLLEQEGFYLQPNDLLYAQPRKIAILRRNISDYSVFLTLLTTTLTTVSTITLLITLLR